MKKTTWAFILLLAAFLLGMGTMCLIRKRCPQIEDNAPIKPDTLYIHDTIVKVKLVPIKITTTDTMLVAVTDTIHHHDTTYMLLPKTQKEYGDSTYQAWVSGYNPQLDSFKIFQTTKIVTKYVKDKRKWAIGPQLSIGWNGDKITPYVGVGISYELWKF